MDNKKLIMDLIGHSSDMLTEIKTMTIRHEEYEEKQKELWQRVREYGNEL